MKWPLWSLVAFNFLLMLAAIYILSKAHRGQRLDPGRATVGGGPRCGHAGRAGGAVAARREEGTRLGAAFARIGCVRTRNSPGRCWRGRWSAVRRPSGLLSQSRSGRWMPSRVRARSARRCGSVSPGPMRPRCGGMGAFQTSSSCRFGPSGSRRHVRGCKPCWLNLASWRWLPNRIF